MTLTILEFWTVTPSYLITQFANMSTSGTERDSEIRKKTIKALQNHTSLIVFVFSLIYLSLVAKRFFLFLLFFLRSHFRKSLLWAVLVGKVYGQAAEKKLIHFNPHAQMFLVHTFDFYTIVSTSTS
jgi:hypothetical protein